MPEGDTVDEVEPVARLGVNSLETSDMMATAESRDVYSYIVGCALPAGQTVTAQDAAGNL